MSLENVRILLAEDEDILARSMILNLRDHVKDIIRVHNGKEAFEKLTEDDFSILITDVYMPEMTGIELVKKVRSHNIDIPILVMTSFGDKKLVVDLLKSGCDGYLDKPATGQDIISAISEVLKKYEQEHEAIDNLIKENADVVSRLKTYQHTYEQVMKNVSMAVDTYKNLMKVSETSFNIPIAYKFMPLSNVGGDFYDIHNTENGIEILIADVAGHDMAASYHALLIKTYFNELRSSGKTGDQILKYINRKLVENKHVHRMVTALYVRIDTIEGKMNIYSAGHPPLIVLKNDKTTTAKEIIGDVLGVHRTVFIGHDEIDVSPKEQFYLYTDGLVNLYKIEPVNGVRIMLGVHGLRTMIEEQQETQLDAKVERIFDNVVNYSRHKINDDMLLMGIEIPGKGVYYV